MYALGQVTNFLVEEGLYVSCRDGLVSRVCVCGFSWNGQLSHRDVLCV